MLEMWEKGNPTALPVGIQIDTATIQNSMEICQQTRKKTTIWPSNHATGHISWENHNSKRHLYTVFIAALLNNS